MSPPSCWLRSIGAIVAEWPSLARAAVATGLLLPGALIVTVAAGLGGERAPPGAGEARAETRRPAGSASRAPVEPRLGGRLVRGMTIGPIESALHPDKGYGSDSCAIAMREARRMGANWVSITPFGRIWDLNPTGISLTFEQPFEQNRNAVGKAVLQAHEEGLRVLLVPHLWVETGGWRGEVDPGTDAAWEAWQGEYRRFLMEWADVAEESGVDMVAIGVEMRSWVTTARAPLMLPLIRELRQRYTGLVTYAANWDDVEDTVLLSELDVIGINAFYPLSAREGVGPKALLRGGRQVAVRVRQMAERWRKPIIFTEFGYTTRADPAVRPWEWPEHLANVTVDQEAQARAYFALLAPLLDEPWFAGFFVWRVFSNPEDTSQESEWGFSPRGKLAELVLRDAFAAHWAADGPRSLGQSLRASRAEHIAHY